MDDEIRAELQRLKVENDGLRADIQRLAQWHAHTQNCVDTHIQLFKNVFTALENIIPAARRDSEWITRMETRMGKVEDMAIPKLPGEVTMSEAIQQLVNHVGTLTAGVVALKRRVDEETEPMPDEEPRPIQLH